MPTVPNFYCLYIDSFTGKIKSSVLISSLIVMCVSRLGCTVSQITPGTAKSSLDSTKQSDDKTVSSGQVDFKIPEVPFANLPFNLFLMPSFSYISPGL